MNFANITFNGFTFPECTDFCKESLYLRALAKKSDRKEHGDTGLGCSYMFFFVNMSKGSQYLNCNLGCASLG